MSPTYAALQKDENVDSGRGFEIVTGFLFSIISKSFSSSTAPEEALNKMAGGSLGFYWPTGKNFSIGIDIAAHFRFATPHSMMFDGLLAADYEFLKFLYIKGGAGGGIFLGSGGFPIPLGTIKFVLEPGVRFKLANSFAIDIAALSDVFYIPSADHKWYYRLSPVLNFRVTF